MESIGVRELRQNASRYLRRVAAGESISVTDRGRPVAVLVPPPRSGDTYEELVARGELIPARRPTGALLHPPCRRSKVVVLRRSCNDCAMKNVGDLLRLLGAGQAGSRGT